MSFLDLIPKPLLLVVIVGLMGALGSVMWENKGLELELSQTQTKLVAAEKAHADAVIAAQEQEAKDAKAYRAKEQAMQIALDLQREKTDATITDLAAQRDALKLRLKTATATSNPANGLRTPTPSDLKTATGVSNVTLVPRQTDRLIDEAFRADQIRVELLTCYKAYDEASKPTTVPAKDEPKKD